MLDSIGLGNAIANVVYLILLALGVGGAWILFKKKIIWGMFFWASTALNFFAFLYFMGNYRLYPKITYILINKYWPWLNLLLLILLIINFLKNKYAKTKSN
ncbi:MAG: hypothetical protein A2288_00335 [Candidatus Moranbacteria bacterium RIFOXYA12_FULL_44_15]|nr:MAG: hypothetical protein A2288_00335 [Candidatus Moranbacteria bacterium RIFOXYA12_FULL_44_15]OGI35241.1 MAG: hypothetical protein A2259_02965 [Candidatus Moranbacteria bacterium RIFOXYA2_FULL_43_15]